MSLDGMRRRIRWAGVAALLSFSVLSVRLSWLESGSGEAWAARAVDNAVRMQRVPPPRGRILDRAGAVLADTRATVDLVVRPAEVREPEALTEALAPILTPASHERLRDAFEATGLERHRAVVIVRDLDEESVGWVAARRHLLAGAALEAGQTRTYPLGAQAAHVVGTLGEVGRRDLLRLDPERYRAGDLVGRSGLESTLEAWLAGTPGYAARLVDTLGRPAHGTGPWIDALEQAREVRQAAALPGAEVRLTLDHRVQQVAVDALADQTGVAVMLDVHTGALIAYASSPAFDPAELVHGVDRARWAELTDSTTRPLLDRAARGLYPPASTFKLVTAAAAVESGIDPHATVECNGGYQVGRRRFRCWKRGGHGQVDLRTAMMVSCDVWFYHFGLELGPDLIGDVARRMGLGPPTGLGLNDERGGLVPSREVMRQRYGQEWTIGDTASASIGQSINLATPLQLAVMTATVANGGGRVTPWLVDQVIAPDGATLWVGGALPPEEAGFAPDVLAAVRGGMEAVMTGDRGTARAQRIDGLPYAGKTGTAQVVSAALKELRPGRETEDHALFVAYAPLDAPRVAVAVVVEHAGGGSVNAAPIARQMLEAWGRIEGLLPEPELAVDAIAGDP